MRDEVDSDQRSIANQADFGQTMSNSQKIDPHILFIRSLFLIDPEKIDSYYYSLILFEKV